MLRNVPSALPEIRALSTDLEHEPLVEEVLLLQGVVGQFLLCIILLDEVLDDSTRLPERDVGVRVLNSYPSILANWRCRRRGAGRPKPGTRPLGFTSVKGFDLTFSNRMDSTL